MEQSFLKLFADIVDFSEVSKIILLDPTRTQCIILVKVALIKIDAFWMRIFVSVEYIAIP